MSNNNRKTEHEQKLQQRCDDLSNRLAEAEDTLRAIREGEVDAVIVSGSKGQQVFSLVGADSIYRLIVETMKEGAFTVTAEGTILFCNAQFGQLVKHPLEQIVGRRFQEFVASQDHAEASSLLLVAQKQSVKKRMTFQAADNSAVPAYVSASVLNQPEGLSICVVANDLTELENATELVQQLRRQQEALQAANEELAATEEELRVQNEELAVSRAELDQTRARYQDLFETAPDGYLVTDPEGTIQELNRAAAQLLGRPTVELRGNPFSSLLPETAKEEYLKNLESLTTETMVLPRWEVQVKPASGEPFWAAVTAAASHDEEGKIVSLRWLMRDVSARKKAEMTLQESEARFRSVLDNTLDVIYRLNAKTGHYEYISPSCEKIVGYSPEELMNLDAKTSGAMIHPEDLPAFQKAQAELEKNGMSSVEYRQRTKSGNYCWLSNNMSLIKDTTGRILYRDGNIRDISARKQAEEALRKKTEELQSSNRELKHFNSLMVNRELRMVELKKEIDKLCRQFGQPTRYGYGGDAISGPGQRQVK